MAVMIIAGVVSLLFGVVFLFAPELLKRWSDQVNRQLAQLDQTLMQHRVGTGLCLLAIGIFCFASVYYVWLYLRIHS